MLLRIAWRNLGRGWRRTAVVLSAIAVGLTLSILMLAWSKGMMFQMADNAIRTQLAHVAVQRSGYHANPDVRTNLGADAPALLALVRREPGVHASPRVRGEGLVQSARKSVRAVVVGVDAGAEAAVSVVPSALVAGAFLAESRSRLPPVVIGAEMAERLGVDLGDKVVLHVPGEAGLGAFRVRGLYRTQSTEFDATVAYLPRAEAERLFAVAGPTEIALALDDPDDLAAVQARLVSAIAAELGPGRYDALSWKEREPRLSGMLDVAASTSWILYAVVFVAMAFGIANALLMAVYERIREFGVLRSLGLGRGKLVQMVLLESLLMTLVGTVVGLGLALPLVSWLGQVGIDMARFSAALEGYGIGTTVYLRAEPVDVLSPLLLAAATALLAAFWPAWKAARLQPAQALRGR